MKVDQTKTMKRNTQRGQNKVKHATVRIIRRTHGLAAEIAVVAGFDPSYVSKVLKGEKPPSERFLSAVSIAMTNFARRFDRQAFETEYPQE